MKYVLTKSADQYLNGRVCFMKGNEPAMNMQKPHSEPM
jgi:hypothetical protein